VGKTFINVTNKEMYCRFETLEKLNTVEHGQIMTLMNAYKAQVARLYWGMSGIGGLTIFTLGWFISHLI